MRLNDWQRIGIVALAILVALVAATSFAEATCGERGGPGYRGPNGKCVGWQELGRVCGSPPTARCTPEQTAPSADDAARKGEDIQGEKDRQHDTIQRRGTRN
jgi:hypothetical protein